MNVDYDSVFSVFKACVQIKMRNRLVTADEFAAYSRNANAPVCSCTAFLDTRGDALINARKMGETIASAMTLRGATIVNIEMYGHACFFVQVYIRYMKVDIL